MFCVIFISFWTALLCLKLATSCYVSNGDIMQFVLEQGRCRGWEDFVIINPEGIKHEEVAMLRNLSKGWKQSFVIPRLSNLPEPVQSKLSVVCFWSTSYVSKLCNKPAQDVSWLIVVEENEVQNIKKSLTSSETVGIDSDIVLAVVQCNAQRKTNDTIIKIEQVYKVSRYSPLKSIGFGLWSPGEDLNLTLAPPESRKAELLYKLHVGIKNETLSELSEVSTSHILSVMVEVEEGKHVLDIVQSILVAINISYDLVSFPKMGWKNEEGGWTHLLGAVVEGKVEFAAGTVDMSTESVRGDMYLTNAIVRSLSSVFLRHQSGGRLRDVFQSTFSPPLQLSVLLTSLMLCIGMLAITMVHLPNRKMYRWTSDRAWEPSEALLWTISVLCMQGSPWSPKSTSGCVLLLFSLLFALITYNSFAAFITSVLSVHDVAIRSIGDLLRSNIQFGFTQGSTEEEYLRMVEEPNLRSLYYRGLMAGNGVGDVAQGLERIFKDPFAFFASTRIARRAINSLVPPTRRCSIAELAVVGTETVAALPVTKSSHFKILINFWLLRMRERGVLHRIRSHLLPPMPTCQEGQLFTGASISDLTTAYALYLSGLVASCIVLLLEKLWAERRFFKIFSSRRIVTPPLQLDLTPPYQRRPPRYTIK